MAGHSKWANIKHRKGRVDAQRGKIFSKLAKEIMVAARTSGGDPAANITLRSLVQKARSFNMPADNIQRAIKKGMGELEGAALEEVAYEGYGPGGVAIMVQGLTDNKNRTAAEVKHVFSKFGCDLSGQGSVSRSFQRKGLILISTENVEENSLMELVLDAGAEDLKQEGEQFEIVADPSLFVEVVDALTNKGIPMERSEVTMLPDTYTLIEDKDQAGAIIRFIEALEELDDAQDVYSNFDMDDRVSKALEA